MMARAGPRWPVKLEAPPQRNMIGREAAAWVPLDGIGKPTPTLKACCLHLFVPPCRAPVWPQRHSIRRIFGMPALLLKIAGMDYITLGRFPVEKRDTGAPGRVTDRHGSISSGSAMYKSQNL